MDGKVRLLSLVLAAALVCSFLPASALAEENVLTEEDIAAVEQTDVVAEMEDNAPAMLSSTASANSGTCGANLTWTLSADGVLTISGSGAMTDYTDSDIGAGLSPWRGGNAAVTSVVIKEGVTSIGAYAFNGLSSLKNITVPASVRMVGENAFASCTSLQKVSFFEGLQAINVGAFAGCSALKTVSVPASVMFISDDAFANTNGLTIEYAGTEDQWREVYGGTGVTVNWKSNAVPTSGSCGENLTWSLSADGVLTISGSGAMTDYADSNVGIGLSPWRGGDTAVTSVVIQEGVTNIGSHAFWNLPSLESVTVPASVRLVSDYAFGSCTELKEVSFCEGLQAINIGAFDSCAALKTLSIPTSVQFISDNAFSNTNGLTIKYAGTENKWEEIYAGADVTVKFKNNTSLTSGSCGENLTWELSDDGVLTISGSGAMTNYADSNIGEGLAPWCDGEIAVTSVVIGEGVTSIGAYAFNDLPSLENVTVPASVRTVGESAFGSCVSLQKVSFADGLQAINVEAFAGCSALLTVSIPASVEFVGSDVFADCDDVVITYGGTMAKWKKLCSDELVVRCTDGTLGAASNTCGENLTWDLSADGVLTISGTGEMTEYTDDADVGAGLAPWYGSDAAITSVVIGEGVASVGSYAFWDLPDLESVTIPASVRLLGDYAFGSCENLKEVSIPDGLQAINIGAFDNCTALNTLPVPSSVMFISDDAFADTDDLTIVYEGTAKQWADVYAGMDVTVIFKGNDLTGDDQVTEEDAVYLLWNTLFPEMYPVDKDAADFNGDDKVTDADVVSMLWYALFPKEYMPK